MLVTVLQPPKAQSFVLTFCGVGAEVGKENSLLINISVAPLIVWDTDMPLIFAISVAYGYR